VIELSTLKRFLFPIRIDCLTGDRPGQYLKYALFCRDTEEGPNDDLTLRGIIDLIEVPLPSEPPGNGIPLLAEVDVNLAFCIAGATAGRHSLQIAIRAPGIPLNTPPAQEINWEEGIMFQRWIKAFRIPVQRVGRHIALILLDGSPVGEASFMVRFEERPRGE
jgi:hypothetical protein